MQSITDQNLQNIYRQAMSALGAKQYAVAAKVFSEILISAPNHGPSHFQLALILKRAGKAEQAAKHFGAAAKLMPKEPAALMQHGIALGAAGAHAKAASALAKAERLSPQSAEIMGHLAHVYQLMGNLKKAEFNLRKALKLKPKDGSLYRLLSIARKFTADDPYLKQMLAIDPAELANDMHRWELDFAITKALEDTKNYSGAFPYLKRANDLVAKVFPYDAKARRDQVAQLREAQRDLKGADARPDHVLDAPIFVTGMPRSGTTLIEQIIGAHSEVTSMGEAGFIAPAVEGVLGKGGGYRHVNEVANKLRSAVADKYLADVANRFPNARRTVDKSIQTYLYLGVIKAIMPNAKFVIVRRDPRDNLLSIYRNMFKVGAHRYAYDFDWLVDHYVCFQEMVAFWQEQMPSDIYIADYDDLVRSPDVGSRNLIKACGLEWEDQCLDFHKSKSTVTTLSLAQVRQPIYRSSQKAWQRYGDAIQPLLEALEKRGVDVSEWD